MPSFPLNLASPFTSIGSFLIYLAIGFAFGYVLEISGFGNSIKLAGQFYFREMTVLKVMFGAIVVAMVLIFAASGIGLLDYNLIWVNPTYLWPGIVGGLIMGVGFIIGGFCPGTSLVSAATGKIDGMFFVLGSMFGMFLFGETVDTYRTWWNSSYMGRFTLPEWLGLPTGVVVLLVILMALMMFAFGEYMEKVVGGRDLKAEPKWRFGAAGALVVGALAVILIGQPTNADRWSSLSTTKQAVLDQREVQIHPGELLTTMGDRKLNLIMLDVRSEADYNLFHIEGARHITPDDLASLKKQFQYMPSNTVYVVMSNDENSATKAWKFLVAESLPNVYILEGGVNNWLSTFGTGASYMTACEGGQDQLRFEFPSALGAAYPAASPSPHAFELEFTPKIKLDLQRGPTKGGCG